MGTKGEPGERGKFKNAHFFTNQYSRFESTVGSNQISIFNGDNVILNRYIFFISAYQFIFGLLYSKNPAKML